MYVIEKSQAMLWGDKPRYPSTLNSTEGSSKSLYPAPKHLANTSETITNTPAAMAFASHAGGAVAGESAALRFGRGIRPRAYPTPPKKKGPAVFLWRGWG